MPDPRRTDTVLESEGMVSMEATPKELWMLRITGNQVGAGNWLRASDDPPDGDCMLVCFTEADAIATAEHQLNVYDIECVPKLVKGVKP